MFPYQTVTQPVSRLSMVHLLKFVRMLANILSLLRTLALCWQAFLAMMSVCSVPERSTVSLLLSPVVHHHLFRFTDVERVYCPGTSLADSRVIVAASLPACGLMVGTSNRE